MSSRRFVSRLVFTVIGLFAVACTSAQSYPVKPVRIVTAQVGGSQDFGVRLFGPALGAVLGQQVVIENRSGGTIGGEIVSKANPDGHTLIYSGTIFWTLPLMRRSLPYDVLRDFAPITMATRAPLVLLVHPTVPAKTVKELVALARARPGEINFASGGNGSAVHLSGELFKSMAAINIVRIPYNGTGPAITAVLGGEVQMIITTNGSVSQHVKSGRLRPLAVTSAEPTALVPGLPTISASGVPGYESTQKAGLFAPLKTSGTVIERLNREMIAILRRPEMKEKFLVDGVETIGSTPAELAAMVKSEIQKMGEVIRAAGIAAD